MKRELLSNVKVQPYTTGTGFSRVGFLSAILGIKVTTAGDLKLTITHGDTDSAADAVTDTLVFPDAKTKGGVYDIIGVQSGDVVNVDIDLTGLKDYAKISVSGGAAANATLALALGDKADYPA